MPGEQETIAKMRQMPQEGLSYDAIAKAPNDAGDGTRQVRSAGHSRMSDAPFISRRKLLGGFQCPKVLWTAYSAQGLIPLRDAQGEAVFDQGHEAGNLGRGFSRC